jgi:HlyD family secretion protein
MTWTLCNPWFAPRKTPSENNRGELGRTSIRELIASWSAVDIGKEAFTTPGRPVYPKCICRLGTCSSKYLKYSDFTAPSKGSLSENGQFSPPRDTARFRRLNAKPVTRLHSTSNIFSDWSPVCSFLSGMDIARPEFKQQKRRRQILWGGLGLVLLVALTVGVARLKPAAPTVERATIWTDTVKRGSMLRQVRGLGSLVPSHEDVRQIPAETEATVIRIIKLPGSLVESDTILLEMTNPQLEQEAVDAQLQVKAAEAEYQSLKVKLDSDLMTQRAGAATVNADYNEAQRQAQTDKALYDLGVVSGLTAKASQGKAEELVTRNQIEDERLKINQRAIASQLAVQQSKVEEMRALADLKHQQLEKLKVRAGVAGVLVEVPLQVGQHVLPGAELAKIVQPNHLMAELKIPETQARDVQIGEPASIDTHNGIIPGTVSRVDPAVQNGTVTVDVSLTGELPKGARPDLSVDGTIDLEKLDNVLYVGRPAFGQENSTISMFLLDREGNGASRVQVKTGRASVNLIQINSGLKEGDTVILSDMSRWDNTDRVKLD